MKFSAPVLGLLVAIVQSVWAQDCEVGYADTVEPQCFQLKADSKEYDDDWGDDSDAGLVCISINGPTMTLTYSTISYWNLFNAQVFVGDSISDIPTADGVINPAAFNTVSGEYRGNEEEWVVEVDLASVTFDAAQCEADGEATMTIMSHGLIAEICADPTGQGEPIANWKHNTEYHASAGPLNLSGDHYLTMPLTCNCEKTVPNLAPPKDPATGSGDPHFKTWTGDKFDYHGECDLVLVDNPSFENGKGLKVHVRTTRIKYFSYIEKIAIQIGDDVLEFANDVENFLINGKPVEKQRTHHKNYLDTFVVRRDKKALSIRLSERKQNGPKIDLIQRNIGWPAVIVNGGDTDMFAGSFGLLGEWETGKKIARDGKMEMNDEDATAFALEWQVRDTEPLLFNDARAPQFPQQCTPPAKVLGNRLGMKLAREEAVKACAGWKQDKDDCIFDVIATRDVLVASEGSISTVA